MGFFEYLDGIEKVRNLNSLLKDLLLNDKKNIKKRLNKFFQKSLDESSERIENFFGHFRSFYLRTKATLVTLEYSFT
ncbi:MAG: hypothetical protein MHPSP_000427, partial [Paramarteilia canceri]